MAAPSRTLSPLALVALVAMILTFVLVRARVAPPEARGVDAPLGEVSGGRAARTLERLLGDNAPHPVGSAANHALRGRLVAELRLLGFDPQVHVGRACNEPSDCATVENVVVRIPPADEDAASATEKRTVLLLAHYDSVAAGPGAGDDGAAVAALLEVARVLHDAPPKRNPILIVWDDGEEAGLLGAKAFLASDPRAREVAVVLNFEARGTSGPSLMFETSEDDAWLVEIFARVAPHPVTGSLFPAVYELLPNSTDFRLFKRAKTPGMNFAFIGDAQRYHEPEDDLAHLDRGSIQHHADNAFAMARALGDEELAPRKGRSVFFDVLGLSVVHWPAAWAVPIAVLGALGIGLALAKLHRPFRAGFAALMLPQGAAAIVLIASFLARVSGLHRAQWSATPAPFLVFAWAVPIFLLVLFVRQLRKRADRFAAWAAVQVTLSIAGIAVAYVLPGGSYVFVAPAAVVAVLAVGIAAAPDRLLPAGLSVAVIVTGVTVALLWFPIALMLYAALGLYALPGVAAIVGLVLTTFLPAFLPDLAQKTQGG